MNFVIKLKCITKFDDCYVLLVNIGVHNLRQWVSSKLIKMQMVFHAIYINQVHFDFKLAFDVPYKL